MLHALKWGQSDYYTIFHGVGTVRGTDNFSSKVRIFPSISETSKYVGLKDSSRISNSKEQGNSFSSLYNILRRNAIKSLIYILSLKKKGLIKAVKSIANILKTRQEESHFDISRNTRHVPQEFE